MLAEKNPDIVITEEFDEALTRLTRGESLFLTGKAGTGKSTLIRYFLASTDRNVIVSAPTGIAALNVDGYTIHRLFSFGSGITVQHVQSSSYYPSKFARAIKSLDTLIIDEASMVRADLFDCMVVALERFGPKPGERFGGVQIVLVGDLYQLPPVVTEGEVEHFSTRYSSPYIFAADRYEREDFPLIELSTVFRQIGDTGLLKILNAVREGALLEDAQIDLNTRTDPHFRPPINQFWLTLTTTNRIAGARNREMLSQIQEPELKHFSVQTGDLDGFDKPTEHELTYKIGAQIMLLNNDSANRWVNGTMGKIVGQRVDDNETVVSIELSNAQRVEVRPHKWNILRPVVENRTLRHEEVGTYSQLPFRLAWSITIHKSQGQTLERLVVDLTGGTFAYGQLYVALSRCTSMDGLVLRKNVEPKDLKVDQRVRRFLASGGSEIGTRGRVYLGICNVGDVGRMWRPRPAEIALVTEDGTEITTLVNPTRDMGDARAAYGISATDVQLAPLLVDAWAALAPLLAGRTPVGICIDRDLGYLDFELKRNGFLMPMPLGIELDESKLSSADRERLQSPRAIDRARALRDIAQIQLGISNSGEVFPDAGTRTGYLLERGENVESFKAGGLLPPAKTSEQVLAEHLREVTTRSQLSDSAKTLLRKLEVKIGQLILSSNDNATDNLEIDEVLVPGARVCFTGSATDVDGRRMSRSEMEALAEAHGLEAVKTVTKSKCEALVSAEEGSQSTKARNAHKYGKPVFPAEQFLAWIRDDHVAVHSFGELDNEAASATYKFEVRDDGQGQLTSKAIANSDVANEARLVTRSSAADKSEQLVDPLPTEVAADLTIVAEALPANFEAQDSTFLGEATDPYESDPVQEHKEAALAPPQVVSQTRKPAESLSIEAPVPEEAPVQQHNIASNQSSVPETPMFTTRQKGPRTFHKVMGGVFLFLTVGMFIIAVISNIVAPESEAWVPVVASAWMLAIVQLPVWLIWGIIRWKSAGRQE